MDDAANDLPVYHLDELFPDQLAVIGLLGNPPLLGSHGTSFFLSNPQEGISPPHYRSDGRGVVTGIGGPHAVTYVCPVVEVLGRPRMVLPNGDLSEVRLDAVAAPVSHWSLSDSVPPSPA